MIPSIHLVDGVRLVAESRDNEDLHGIHFSHASLESSFTYHAVHVGKVLRSALLEPGEKEVHVVAIDPNGLTSYVLPGRPHYVVTGVNLLDGRRVGDLPDSLRRARRLGFAACVAACLLGIAAMLNGMGVCGGVLLALSAFY